MKKFIMTAAILAAGSTALFAQKYMTRTARITFDATSKGSPEDITAVNNEMASILDSKTGDVVFQVPVKSFKFEKALMQDHFNENYMESDKFPKSDFKGKVGNLDALNFAKDGSYPTTVAGKLTIHGVSNDVNVPGTIVVKGTAVTLKAKFTVKLADYKISVPNMVSDKVGKEAVISLEGVLNQK